MKPVSEDSKCPVKVFHSRSSFGDYCLYCEQTMKPEKLGPLGPPPDDVLDNALRIRPTDPVGSKVFGLDPRIDYDRDDDQED